MKYCIPIDVNDADAPMAPRLGRAAYLWIKDPAVDGEPTIVPNPGAAAEGGAGVLVAQAIVDSGAGAVVAPHIGEHAARVLGLGGILMFHAAAGQAADLAEQASRGELPRSAGA